MFVDAKELDAHKFATQIKEFDPMAELRAEISENLEISNDLPNIGQQV
jgi:hypothetical protein